MDLDDLTPIIQNVVVMDSEGKRIAVKYYNDEWCADDPFCSGCTCTLYRHYAC